MMNMLLVIGLVAICYGIFGIFYHYPQFEYIDRPFPLEHSTLITPNPDGNGYRAWSFADPIISVNADPYWLAWSVSFYAGISMVIFLGTKNRIQKLQNK